MSNTNAGRHQTPQCHGERVPNRNVAMTCKTSWMEALMKEHEDMEDIKKDEERVIEKEGTISRSKSKKKTLEIATGGEGEAGI